MGADCCGQEVKFDGLSADYKRRLWAVIAINAAMFAVELGAGALAGSQALQADALDFLGELHDLRHEPRRHRCYRPHTRARCRPRQGSEPDRHGAMGARLHRLSRVDAWPAARGGDGRHRPAGFGGERRQRADYHSLQGRRRQCAFGSGSARATTPSATSPSCWPPPRCSPTGTRWPDLIVAALMAALFLTSSLQIPPAIAARTARAASGAGGMNVASRPFPISSRVRKKTRK